MYDELIKRLREIHPEDFGNYWVFAFACQLTMNEAADAIEELSKPKWIKFEMRELDPDEKKEHPDWCYVMDCQLPDDGQEILVSKRGYVFVDTFCYDDGCYLDSGDEIEDGMAWMPLPEPYKEAKE